MVKNCIFCDQTCPNNLTCSKCSAAVHESCANKIEDNKIACFFCCQESKIDLERAGALDGLQKQAKRMKLLSDKKFGEVSVGKTVRIPIPDVDRGKGDLRNILGVVLEITDDGYYRVGTKSGRLDRLYARSQFSVCKEDLIAANDVPDCNSTLRSVANAQSNGKGQGMYKCNCTGKCETKKCRCKKFNRLCNSRCHKSNSCCNK